MKFNRKAAYKLLLQNDDHKKSVSLIMQERKKKRAAEKLKFRSIFQISMNNVYLCVDSVTR